MTEYQRSFASWQDAQARLKAAAPAVITSAVAGNTASTAVQTGANTGGGGGVVPGTQAPWPVDTRAAAAAAAAPRVYDDGTSSR